MSCLFTSRSITFNEKKSNKIIEKIPLFTHYLIISYGTNLMSIAIQELSFLFLIFSN